MRVLDGGDEVRVDTPNTQVTLTRPGLYRIEVAPDPGATRPAVREGELHEIKSPLILQPGPAALTDGVTEIARIIRACEALN